MLSQIKLLEDTYIHDTDEINNIYNKKFIEFNEKSEALINQLNDKHRQEMEKLIEELELKLQRPLKFSKEYLDLKESEANLVRQER